ncbi:MAG: DedA family protein [Desulfovibrionaceae bacterium]|nr:DedA family protein [Desulfovibrionaceae bacterium]MBF0513371.1 DedA family protein [Desulfovibrionaceae bacterium]
MSVEELLAHYGYLALFIGTFLEGETILLVAGYLSSLGHLDLTYCITAAFCGSLCGDQFAFYIGRWKGNSIIEKRESWRRSANKLAKMIERYHELIVLSFRFFYGLRNVTPFYLGTTSLGSVKFLLLNATGAFVWALTFGFAGFLFGSVVERFMTNVKHIQMAVIGAVAVTVCVVWIIRRNRKHKK